MSATIQFQKPKDPDLEIVIEKKSYKVWKEDVMIKMDYFREHPLYILLNIIDINLPWQMDPAKIQLFFEIAEKENYSNAITQENFYDLYLLSNYFKFEALKAATKKFIDDNSDPNAILSKAYNFYEQPELENYLSKNINFAFTNDSFKKMPLEVIARIVFNATDVDNHSLLKFILEMLSEHGQTASILSKKIVLNSITTEELQQLIDHPNFLIDMLDVSQLVDIHKEMTSMKERINQLEDYISKLKT